MQYSKCIHEHTKPRKTVVSLTWWPLFRNFGFYIVSTIILTLFFLDDVIELWEAGILLGLYVVFAGIMVANGGIMKGLQRICSSQESDQDAENTNNLEGKDGKPLDMSPPKTVTALLAYIFLFPVRLPLWITLPDTRKPSSRKLFPISLVGSIIWICIFLYLLIWWSTVAGNTLGVPPEVMGLTILALTTNLPLLTMGIMLTRYYLVFRVQSSKAVYLKR